MASANTTKQEIMKAPKLSPDQFEVVVNVPAVFWDDHEDRAPSDKGTSGICTEIARTTSRVLIRGNAEQIGCLRRDAIFYSDRNCMDAESCPVSIIQSAKRTIKALAAVDASTWKAQAWAKDVTPELATSLDNIAADDQSPPTLADAVKEAFYVISLHYEGGTTSSEMLAGDHGPDAVREAQATLRGCAKFIRKYEVKT